MTSAVFSEDNERRPRLLDQVRDLALQAGHLPAAAQSFVEWNRRFILFHEKRHPKEMGLAEIGRYLQHVVQVEKDPLPALEASRKALDFLYGSSPESVGRFGQKPDLTHCLKKTYTVALASFLSGSKCGSSGKCVFCFAGRMFAGMLLRVPLLCSS